MLEEAGAYESWRRLPEAGSMTRQHLLPKIGKGRAADRRRRPGKTGIDDLGIEPNDLEDLRALVAVDGGNAHLGENFQSAVFDGLDVAFLGRRRRQGGHRLESERRADRLRSIAQQRDHVMDVTGFVGLVDQAGPSSQAASHEVMVHTSDRTKGGYEIVVLVL